MADIIIKTSIHGCGTDVFSINGVNAWEDDFGELLDVAPYKAPEFGCGDKRFVRYEHIDSAVLERYHITESEHEEIIRRLESELHFGFCALCQ